MDRPRLSPLHEIRQSVSEDAKTAAKLETEATKAMFGNVDISDFIAKYVCKSMFNKANELVALIVVRDWPNIPCFTMCHWENWMKNYYRLNSATPWNTIFIHYLVWDSRYPKLFIHFFNTFYKNSVHLEHILLVAPPRVIIFKELAQYFTPISPQNVQTSSAYDTATIATQTVYLNLRLTLKKLVVRKAVEEDNIDVQPILYCQYDVLKQVYGDFKLSKVIDDPHKQVIVAEKENHRVVGMMSLTSDVDYQHANTFFHVPLQDYVEQVNLQGSGKITVGQADWPIAIPADSDLFSFKTGHFKEEPYDALSEKSVPSTYSGLYLKDSESEFRIVDPAMDYLLNKRYRETKNVEDHFDTEDPIECKVNFDQTSKSSSRESLIEEEIKIVQPDLPGFNGPHNGFQVSLFALHPDLDNRYAFDLLEAAFACFPDKNYCLLSLPTSYQGSPLVQHCVRLTPGLSQDFPHELYIVHKNSIFSQFTVRQMTNEDFYNVAELIGCDSAGQKILMDVEALLSENCTGSRGFLMDCEDSIVGFALVTEGFRLEIAELQYCLEDVLEGYVSQTSNHGILRHAIVLPVFLKAAPFFLRQILQLAGLDSLSYCHMPAVVMTMLGMSMPSVLGDLCPVRPRRRVQYDLSALEIGTEEHLIHPDTDYALFIATEKTLSIPKLELNYRVVVVGSSNVALSFLEHLIFGAAKRSILYNNLTLISLHGLPLKQGPHAATDKMNPHNGHYDRDYLARLSLQTHVNVLYGVVDAINRKDKMICVNGDYWMRYDYLFLFTGVQFSRPIPANLQETDTGGCQKDVNTLEILTSLANVGGNNLFLINSTADASIALGRLKRIVETKKSGKILVYGNCINIYCCVEALLTLKVPGNKIILVQSSEICPIAGLGNIDVIEEAVLQSLRQVGVAIHQGFTLRDWVVTTDNTISKVMFRSEPNVSLNVECLALFCYTPKVTSTRTYKALSDAGIVYNGGIIINNEFRTNDESVFAAGPGTKYSSLYQANQAHHRLYNSVEVGYQASQIFRAVVEPSDRKYPLSLPPPGILPRLTWPKIMVAKLPGGWNYFRMSAPGPPLPLECQLQGQGDSGRVLITGDPIDPDGPGYFQLSLSVFNAVIDMTCFSKREIPHHNLQCLYGKHEKLLNNLVERYDLGLVTDLYTFFSQPWAYALYTSGFDDLVCRCTDVFKTNEDVGEALTKLFNTKHKHVAFNKALRSVVQKYELSSVPLNVQVMTLNYVKQRALQLPMYQDDALMEAIHRTYTASPLHRPLRRSSSPLRHLGSFSHRWRSSWN